MRQEGCRFNAALSDLCHEEKERVNRKPVALAGANSNRAHASGLHAFCFHRC